MSYERDTSEDLVWNSNTNSYEPASTPATSGYLTDGNGNIFLFNGKAIYISGELSTVNLTIHIISNNPAGAYTDSVITVGEQSVTYTYNSSVWIHGWDETSDLEEYYTTIQVPTNTNLSWNIAPVPSSGYTISTPTSGTLNISEDSSLRIIMTDNSMPT